MTVPMATIFSLNFQDEKKDKKTELKLNTKTEKNMKEKNSKVKMISKVNRVYN